MDTQENMTEIGFNQLVITCDGKHTRVVVDGIDMSRACRRIVFEHNIEKNHSIHLEMDHVITPGRPIESTSDTAAAGAD